MWGVSRLGRALGGLVDMVEAPPEFLWDVGENLYATLPGGPELADGFWASSFGDLKSRGAQALGGAFGPQGFGGQVAGGIPQPVRNPIARALFGTNGGNSIDRPGFGMDEAFDGGLFGLAEGIGREFIREPLATAMTASSLAASETWGGDGSGLLMDIGSLGQMFRPATWKKAHEISQTRSVGQAVALGILSKDILDEDEVTKVQGSAWYSVISGGFDAAARIFLDTDTLTAGFAADFYKASKPGSKSVAIANAREADALRKIGKVNVVKDRALAAAEKAAVESVGEAPDLGRVLKVPAINRLESSLANQGDELASFFGEEGARVGVANISDTDMRRATYQLMGPDAASALDEAVNLAAGGDTANLHKWLQRHGLKLPASTIADIGDDAAVAYDQIARAVADRKGYNALSFTDEAGAEVGLMELGNRPTRFGVSDRARKKFAAEEVGRVQTARLAFEAFRPRLSGGPGGWEGLLARAEGDAARMSRIAKGAREEFLASQQWRKTEKLLSALHFDPEVMAAELLARTKRQAARMAERAGISVDELNRIEELRQQVGQIDTDRSVTQPPGTTIETTVEDLRAQLGEVERLRDEADATLADPELPEWLAEDFVTSSRLRNAEAGSLQRELALREELASLESRVTPGALDTDLLDATEADELLSSFDGAGNLGWAQRAEVIRDRFFHDMAEGDLLASWFASAYTTAERDALMRFVMGDFPSIEVLRVNNPGLARQVETVAMRRQMIRLYPDNAALIDPIEEFRLFNDPAQWGQNEGLAKVLTSGYKVEVQDVLDDIATYVGRDTLVEGVSSATLELQRLMVYASAQADFMKVTTRGRLRDDALRGGGIIQKVWQSPYNKTRVVFDMVAHPFIGVDDPMVVPKLKRHLRDAGFDTAETETMLGQFAAIRWQEDSRKLFLDGVVRDGIAKLAAKHGIVDNELVEEVLARVSRATTEGSLYARQAVKYAGVDRLTGKNFSRVSLVDPITGAVEHVFQPLTPEQLQNAHLMPNFRQIDKAMKRMGEGWKQSGLRGKDLLMRWPGMAAEQVNRIWKPSVLLRPAWPMRVVFDEQLRMMSVLGVMNNLAATPARFRNLKMQYMRELFPMRDKDRNILWMGVDEEGKLIEATTDSRNLRSAAKVADPTRARNRLGAAGAAAGFGLAGPVGALAGGVLGARMGARGADLANGLQLLHNSSTQNIAFDGYSLLQAFGAPGDRAEVLLDEVSAGRQLNHLVMQDRAVEELNRLKLDPRRWRSLDPDDAHYPRVWDHAVNRQFRGSPFSRLLWDDTIDEEDIVAWLEGEISLGQGQTYSRAAGRQTARSMPKYRRENLDEWVSEARAYINTNLIPPVSETVELRARLAAGDRVDLDDVQEAIARHNAANGRVGGDELRLGSVHGQELIEVMDKGSELSRTLRRHLDNAFVHLGKTPTDTLSRQPFFMASYREAVESQVARIKTSMDGDTYRMSARELRNLEDAARKTALHKTRTLLYDLAEESQFAQVVRNMMPFFNAWQEVLTRYAGIALDNPLYMSRLYKAYNAPATMEGSNFGIDSYEDEYGNEFIRFRLPSVGKALLNQGFFASAVDSQGYVMFDRRGLNMLAQGTPGFGPLVAYPVSKVAAERPELEESLQFMFPYGVPSGLKESFLPAAGKRLVSGIGEDKAFAIAQGRIAIDKLVTAELLGEPVDFSDPEVSKQFFADVRRETKAFFHVRTLASMVSPLAPMYQSPYQDIIDDFRRLQREDPTTADEKFLAQYGHEYFAITQSMSKTIDGVPATIPGEAARAKYESLIEAYPEFGSLIVGAEGGGVGVKFSRAIYDKQFQEAVSEGDPRARREVRPLTEIVTDPDRRLGWQKWSKFYDWKVDQMARMGISSSSSAEAQGIMAVQRIYIDQLRQAHPSWFEDFADRDETKWIRRMEAFRHIVDSDNADLTGRQDIVGLRQYLDARQQVEQLLQARDAAGGSSDLSATSNRDLAMAWETMQTKLVERNPMFSDLHGRWLIDDTVVRDSWKAVATRG